MRVAFGAVVILGTIVLIECLSGHLWSQEPTQMPQGLGPQSDRSKTPAPGKQKAAKESASDGSEDVFGLTKVWHFHLELTTKEWDKMQPTGGMRFPGGFGPKKPDDKPGEKPIDVHKGSGFGLEFPWVHADLSAEGKNYKDVGLRYKGNATYGTTSRGLKRNFRIDLDHHDDKLRFHGLKSITLNAGGLDPSRGREAFSYAVFRAVGVPAPRTAFAELTISMPGKYDKEFVGLYTFVEHVDKTFLMDRFKNNKGLLMKPEGVRDIQYLGEDWKRYEPQYRPKHDPTAKEKRRVIEFAKLVDRGSDEEFQKQIASYLDVDQFLRFIAVNAYLVTIDNFFMGGHNYFLYLNPQTNKFVFIPWDMDVSLAGVPFVGSAEQRMDLSLTHPHAGQHKLIDRLLAMNDVNESYQKLLKELAGTAFSRERLLAEVDAIESVTRERLAREKKATEARKEGAGGPGFGFALGSGMFGQGPSLRTFVEKRTASVAAQLAGERKGYVLAGMGFGPPGPPGRPGGGFGAGGGPGGDFGPGMVLAKPILESADADRDGKLSKEETADAVRRLFARFDENKKGGLDERALAIGFSKLLPGGPGRPGDSGPSGPPGGFPFDAGPGRMLAHAVIQRADVDKDGKVTLEEFLAAAESLFAECDKDKNRALDEQEIATGINRLFSMPQSPGPPGFPPGVGPLNPTPEMEEMRESEP
jgi:spore coat protein H